VEESKVLVVLGSLVWSGLLSNFGKTETKTSPHKLEDPTRLDQTDINQFRAVLCGFLRLQDWSEPVYSSDQFMTSLGPVLKAVDRECQHVTRVLEGTVISSIGPLSHRFACCLVNSPAVLLMGHASL